MLVYGANVCRCLLQYMFFEPNFVFDPLEGQYCGHYTICDKTVLREGSINTLCMEEHVLWR